MGNKNIKKELIKLYGPECFIEKLHLRPDDTPRYYTSKAQMKKMKQLTYHHIKEKRNGGVATVENGALLSVENHQWFNKQPPEVQDELNKKFQEYKKCSVVFSDDFTSDIEIKVVKITPTEQNVDIEPVNIYENMTKEEIEIYKQHKKERNDKVFKKFKKENEL